MICGECKYHKHCYDRCGGYVKNVWYCDNEDSEYYAYQTEYEDSCADGEGRDES